MEILNIELTSIDKTDLVLHSLQMYEMEKINNFTILY